MEQRAFVQQSDLVGVYRHYKGNQYRVLAVATNTESQEKLVIYQSLYGDFAIWARPLDMFLSEVEYQGVLQLRFQKID